MRVGVDDPAGVELGVFARFAFGVDVDAGRAREDEAGLEKLLAAVAAQGDDGAVLELAARALGVGAGERLRAAVDRQAELVEPFVGEPAEEALRRVGVPFSSVQ